LIEDPLSGPLTRRRSQLSIIAKILGLARGGVLKTRLMYGASLSVPQLDNYLSFLLDVNLLDAVKTAEKTIYITTNKGLRYLECCREIEELSKKARVRVNIREGEVAVVTYTSAVDKMKVFSAFIREGLENGDLVDYSYPDGESETIRAKLEKYGINVEKYEREGSLLLSSLTEYYVPDGRFDKERAIRKGLDDRAEAKRKGYKHIRELEDLGDFSFINGQWQRYIDCWDDPRWETPSGPDIDILDYTPFVIELTAFNVEGVSEAQLAEMLKAFWVGNPTYTVSIDLLEYTNAFSKLLGISHKKLVSRNFLLEFDPTCEYEKVINSFTKEAIANVEPIFVFTSPTSILHAFLAKHPAVKFFLLSTSTLTPKSKSENEVILPAENTTLILDALNKVLEEFVDTNIFLVFDKISELIFLVGFDEAYKFLVYVSDMLSQTKATAVFLLNKNAHEPNVCARIRGLFHNQLTYNEFGLRVVKIS